MKEELVKELALIVGEDWITLEEEKILGYLYDQTPDPMKPEPSKDVVVVKPKNAEEVSKILLVANKYRMPVFPRGGGTGLAADPFSRK
ncbi:MAG: FAD-binding oxidoreductase [Thaumarchaeota archaeon]|nr:FAD-binding oxidoreductase [Nitrososphaerota archaeon]